MATCLGEVYTGMTHVVSWAAIRLREFIQEMAE